MHHLVADVHLVWIGVTLLRVEPSHARGRMIKKIEVPTPLVVPSFSSRGFSEVLDIYNEMKYRLYGVCLVSASDIAENRISEDVTDATNLVIIDSGLFENGQETSDTTFNALPPRNVWPRSRYHETLRRIGNRTNTVMVNYDQRTSVEKQIKGATEDFACVPDAASDFLIKPATLDVTVNVPAIAHYTPDIRRFDIVGVTACETGYSFLNRCSAIVTLRDILSKSSMETPIHVFGAISPCEILTYFFCGADIFDGLNWLRMAYRDHGIISLEDAAIEEMKWNRKDHDLLLGEWTNNLRVLYHLQESMRRYADSGSIDGLISEFPLASKCAHVAEISGAEI